ncbi:hypothetical protein RJT34_12854 [Clitoria ternatea]|uniref:Uncharacterized protein n=1 Tax=Clitoria ternatea TaxID=43366 RepID=A0AAN9JMU9_CLITE
MFNPVDDRYFISGSSDAKVRIWSIPDRQVVDRTDLHEMVTAACYTLDGQFAPASSSDRVVDGVDLVNKFKGCQPNLTSTSPVDQRVELPYAQGLQTLEALSIVLHRAEQLLGDQAVTTLSVINSSHLNIHFFPLNDINIFYHLQLKDIYWQVDLYFIDLGFRVIY